MAIRAEDYRGVEADDNMRATTGGASEIAAGADFPGLRNHGATRVVIVERNAFLRDCLQRAIASLWAVEIATCDSLSELNGYSDGRFTLVLLSIVSLTEEEADEILAQVSNIGPAIRSMVLARTDDLNDVLVALSKGASGYISMSAGFEVFIQALRFVGAGGNYVPTQCLLSAKPSPVDVSEQALTNGITSRELEVIQAIRQGKPNKVIAYELNMCESTVKVHVRHIMRKLKARNRTDVAIKGAEMASSGRQESRPRVAAYVPVETP